MDLLGSASESLRIEGDSVAETRAQGNQKICAVHGFVRGDAAVHAAHSQAAGVIVTDAACGHKSVCSRAVGFFHQFIELSVRTTCRYASAAVDDGAL